MTKWEDSLVIESSVLRYRFGSISDRTTEIGEIIYFNNFSCFM